MILFPEAKINVGLFVTARREDGYHVLQTVFYPIEWCDALEVLARRDVEKDSFVETEDKRIRWRQTGIRVDCDPEANLCVKAYRMLQGWCDKRNAKLEVETLGANPKAGTLGADLPAVDMILEKRIPFGAGLGGGSSDGAHALLMLRKMFELAVSDAELEAMAAKMGADCAFFCRCGNGMNTADNGNRMKAYYCDGIGYELEPHPLSLKGKYLVVVKPPFGVSTREAYSGVRVNRPEIPLTELLQRPLEEWTDCIHNDFEDSVFPLYPQLAKAKQTLYDHGAVYASMSGSGSALFGFFDHEPEGFTTWFDQDYQVRGHWALV